MIDKIYNGDPTNNMGINIPNYLAEKYPNWLVNFPEVYQLNEDLIPTKTWRNKKDIAKWFGKRIQGVDLALRKCVRFQGYYFVIKVLYDEGLRPIKTPKRNDMIYAYDPSQDLLNRYYDYEEFHHEDFFKEGLRETFRFIGRFRNSVVCADYLDLSITNIRQVAKQTPNLLFHKDYYFSFVPIMPIHEIEADIIDLSAKNQDGTIKDEEKIKLLRLVKEFKDLYTEEGRVVGGIEKKLYKLICEEKNDIFENIN